MFAGRIPSDEQSKSETPKPAAWKTSSFNSTFRNTLRVEKKRPGSDFIGFADRKFFFAIGVCAYKRLVDDKSKIPRDSVDELRCAAVRT